MVAAVQKFPLGGLKLSKMLWLSALHQGTLPGCSQLLIQPTRMKNEKET